MNRGALVYLATDPESATGTVCGELDDGRVVVAWHIGRTWLYEKDDLVEVGAIAGEAEKYLEVVEFFRAEGCECGRAADRSRSTC